VPSEIQNEAYERLKELVKRIQYDPVAFKCGAMPNRCMVNVALWTKLRQDDIAVPGWLYYAGMFIWHWVVKDKDGNLFDITPINGEANERIADREFIEDHGSGAEFCMRKGWDVKPLDFERAAAVLASVLRPDTPAP